MQKKYISQDDFEKMERLYRANLINSVSGLKPLNLIGTINESGITNVAVFSSVMHLGANPALLAFIQRPLTNTSNTYKNILTTKYYTINHVNTNIVENAHYTSAKFDDNISEFETCKLTPVFTNNFKAPYVLESAIQIGMELLEFVPIKHNNTTLVVGKIIAINIAEELINEDGNIDLAKSKSVSVAGLETYYKSTAIAKFPYAKPETILNFKRNESN